MSRIEGLKVIKSEWDGLKEKLGQQPPKQVIDANTYAGGALYVPIGYIQAKLDQVFLSWDWTIIKSEVIHGNCCVTGTLTVNTISGNTITRSGIGVTEVKVTDALVIKKALEKGYPKADAQALKNAAQKLGNIFGRSLNRKFKFGHVKDDKLIDRIFGDVKEGEDE